MKGYDRFKAINKHLAVGDRIYVSQVLEEQCGTLIDAEKEREIHYPRIGVYTGTGTSHSWLWFADIFDRMGFYAIRFLNEDLIKEGALDQIDVLAMSGGDTFSIAQGMGRDGANALELFIRQGGLYLGSCAGAYLPLRSSKEHLNYFNYVPAKIANLSKFLPQAIALKEKFCTSYGCSFIFHPVREAVRLKINGFIPFSGVRFLFAPLYGGPSMIAYGTAQVLATYADFTEKTLFLVDEALARETLLGKAAVIRERMGQGHLYLFGPHFEHPWFPMANQLLANVMYWHAKKRHVSGVQEGQGAKQVEGKDCKGFLMELKREISNSRIVSVGLETLPIHWTIGEKVYEPEKIRVFVEAIWKRICPLEILGHVNIRPGQDEQMIQYAKEVVTLLRLIKADSDQGGETLHTARMALSALNRTCTLFLDMYFRTKMWHFAKVGDA